MNKRENDLLELKLYTEGIDKELSMILQSLQWDRNDLLKGTTRATCKYDKSHRILSDKSEEHERTCFYKRQGYSSKDTMLPDPLDISSNTLVKLSNEDICRIIDNASKSDPSFKKGNGNRGPEPASLARLQAAYTADERRAIHDAVVSAVPSCHDLADLALLSSNGTGQKSDKSKSRVEILAELRDMRRRRAKYRVAAKTRNYSDVLRDVIKTQMEFYSDVHLDASIATTNENREINETTENIKYNEHSNTKQIDKADHYKRDRYKKERHTFNDRDSRWSSDHTNRSSSDRDKYVKRSRDRKDDHREDSSKSKYEERGKHDSSSNRADRDGYKDRSRDRRYDDRAEYIKREEMESCSSSQHKYESRSHKTGRVREESKERKYVKRDSIKREDWNKYDKYKSRDSKRRYEEQPTRFDREGERDQLERGEKYKRFYDF